MKSDREIKNFFRALRPELPDGREFMAEFVRQSALLPQPASFKEKENLDKAEALHYLARLSGQLRRQNRHLAAVVIVAVVLFSLLSAAAVFYIPDLDLMSLFAGSQLQFDPEVFRKAAAMFPDWRTLLITIITIGSLYAIIYAFTFSEK